MNDCRTCSHVDGIDHCGRKGCTWIMCSACGCVGDLATGRHYHMGQGNQGWVCPHAA